MAERRMFAKSVINSARFLRMPQSSRLLYYDLGMNADDDGIVEAFTVMRATGANEDDLRVLAAKGFVTVLNEELVTFITDWKVNNSIRSDRYHRSFYSELLVKLNSGGLVDMQPSDNQVTDKRYTNGIPSDNQMTTNGIPSDNQVGDKRYTEVRLGKDSIGKDRLDKDRLSNTSYSCAEPKCDSTPPVIALPLNTGEEYPICSDKVGEWSSLYPAVDVMQQLRNMRGWLLANPDKRKTKRGINRFVVSWLSREQDRGGRGVMPNPSRGATVRSEPSLLDELPL